MINNPQDFFDQVRNLCEELGLRIKSIGESLSTCLTKSEAEKYLEKAEASNTYLGKSDKAASASVADSATSANTASRATSDASGNNISSTYLKIATASSTYLTKTDASSSYLGKTAKAESAKTADTATTATSATSATKATQDGDGNVISGTYLKSATAQSTYLGKTAKAESAKTADSATKAMQDGSGNPIATTYATVASLNTTNTNVTNAQTTATQAKTLAEAKVGISGNRGQLAGYETSGTATTINANSPDSNQVGTNVTVANGSANTAWTKVVRLTAAVTVTLGSAWQWAGGEAPETSAGGVIVLCWCGEGGVANFVSVSA